MLVVLTCWRSLARANMLAREQETFVFSPNIGRIPQIAAIREDGNAAFEPDFQK